MSNKKHETETTFGHGKEAEASQADRHAPEAVASQSQTAPETTSGHENKAKSGSNKKTRGLAFISSKMRNFRTGAPFNWDNYKENEDHTSFKFPISGRVAEAAQYIDRSISPAFTKAVMIFLDQNWDESLPMARQSWYRKLQSTEVPDMVELEAARAVNGGEFPVGIFEAAKLSQHGQKWLGEQQKNTFNEQQQKAAADKRNTAASPANSRASKKIRKSYDDEDEDVIGGI